MQNNEANAQPSRWSSDRSIGLLCHSPAAQGRYLVLSEAKPAATRRVQPAVVLGRETSEKKGWHTYVVPNSQLCVDRAELAATVAKAVQELYDAKSELENVRALQLDPTNLLVKLSLAKAAKRDAVAALDKHRKKHGC